MQAIYKDFIFNNLETTVKLMEVLTEIFSNKVLKEKFTLKGGSAVNFYLGELTRLFSDIDLDLKEIDGALLDKEKALISFELLEIMKKLNYEYSSSKSRHSYSLDSFKFPYKKKNGNLDYLKIEINYSCGKHLYSDVKLPKEKNFIDTDITVVNLSELIGMKMKALFDRLSAKDLFDIYKLIGTMPSLDCKEVRKAFLFYYTLASLNYDFNTIKRLENITKRDCIAQLYSSIPKNSGVNLERMKREVSDFAYGIFDFTSEELEFCKAFQEGYYQPELLFDDEDVIARAEQNKLATYKIKLKRKYKQIF